MTPKTQQWQRRCAIGLALFYGVAGLLHVLLPEPFLTITPDWVPMPRLVILLTGLCEILGAIGLVIPSLRRPAGVGLALYAVCVFPANIKHALDTLTIAPSLGLWAYHLVRLPLQPVIVWAALFAGGLLAWPLRKQR